MKRLKHGLGLVLTIGILAALLIAVPTANARTIVNRGSTGATSGGAPVFGQYYQTTVLPALFPQVRVSPFTAYRKRGVSGSQFIRGTILLYSSDGISGWSLFKTWTAGLWVKRSPVYFVGEPVGPVEGFPGLTFGSANWTQISATIIIKWYNSRRKLFGVRYIYLNSTRDYGCAVSAQLAPYCHVGYHSGRAYVYLT